MKPGDQWRIETGETVTVVGYGVGDDGHGNVQSMVRVRGESGNEFEAAYDWLGENGTRLTCATCQRALNNPADPYSMDCGGDCLKCMADAGDPTCVEAVEQIKRERKIANATTVPVTKELPQ